MEVAVLSLVHNVHALAPPAEVATYFPASQLVQTDAPVVVMYVPAPQAAQFSAWEAE